MGKGILGPSVVTLCLGSIGGFHLYKTMGRSQYLDANKNVSELLENENFKIVSFEANGDSTWGEIINAYKTKKSTDFGEIGDNDEEFKQKLKSECKNIIEKPTQSLSTYNKARKWCVVPQTITRRLELEGRFALDSTKDESHWSEIAEQYEGKEIKSFGITKTTKKDQMVEKMKAGCKPLLVVHNWDNDFDSSFEKTKRFCSAKKQTTMQATSN